MNPETGKMFVREVLNGFSNEDNGVDDGGDNPLVTKFVAWYFSNHAQEAKELFIEDFIDKFLEWLDNNITSE